MVCRTTLLPMPLSDIDACLMKLLQSCVLYDGGHILFAIAKCLVMNTYYV